MQAVRVHGSRAKINFPLGSGEDLQFVAIDPRVVSCREALENREAFERIDAACAEQAYMVEIHRNHPKLVAEEFQVIELYKNGADEARSSDGEVIDLYSNDSGSGSTTAWIWRCSRDVFSF